MKLVPALLLASTALMTPLFAAGGSCACKVSTLAMTSLSDTKTGKLIPVEEKDAAWAAKARETYPLKTCVISGEELGGMGKPAEYIYRVEGQADRLVRFCCDGCEEDFLKDPAAALKKIDDASKAKPSTADKPSEKHGHHAH